MFSIFALATSMAWFPVPDEVSPEVIEFLRMEEEYLSQELSVSFVVWWLAVPATFILLGMAFWKRSFIYVGLVIATSVFLKIVWSVIEGGESAGTLIQTAIAGLIITLLIIYLGYRKQKE